MSDTPPSGHRGRAAGTAPLRVSRQPIWPLLPILGKMPFWGFLGVTVLVVSLLAAISLVSKYVVKNYVDDQLRQIEWDQVVYQFFDLPAHDRIRSGLTALPDVERVETLGWLRLRLTPETSTTLSGGRGVFIPWVTLVSASDLRVLPPALREEGTLGIVGGSQQRLQAVGAAVARTGTLRITQPAGGDALELVATPFHRVVQIDRQDLIQWVMREVGSTTFIGHEGLVVVLPFSKFSAEVERLTAVSRKAVSAGPSRDDEEGGDSGQDLAFTPEVAHLLRLKRAQLVSGWDVNESARNVKRAVEAGHRVAQQHSFRSVTNSDLLLTLDKLGKNQKLVAAISVLLSTPILVMVWVFAGSLANLVVLNSKRTMGLLRLRGVSGHILRRTTLVSIGVGGLVGGIIGGPLGTLVPAGGYELGGERIPWSSLHRIQEPGFLIGFIVVATIFAMASGRKVANYCTRVTPHDAAARVSSSEAAEFAFRWGWIQAAALILGGYKVLAWAIDYTPPGAILGRLDRMLDFLAAPLFIYGVTALVVAQSAVTRALFFAIASPIAGTFRWFVVSNMMMRPHRTISAILIAALMFAITLYPRVTADSFYEKLVRGVRLNTGADFAVVLDSGELLGGEVSVAPLGQQLAQLSRKARAATDAIGGVDGVQAASPLYEMQIPGHYYLPGGMTNLPIYVVEDESAYLSTTYHEETVGVRAGFVADLAAVADGIVISQGLASFENIDVGRRLILGDGASGEVTERVSGVVALLPGAPRIMVQGREAYVGAEIEYLNLIGRSSPFMVGSARKETLSRVQTVASRTVVLVRTSNVADAGAVRQGIEGALAAVGVRPLEIKSVRDEEGRLSKDMFVSLGLENVRIYLIGGIAVALSGILAISLANFQQMRRTLALIRVRGGKPRHLRRIVVAEFFVPIVLGMVTGVLVGLVTGYGLANQMFKVPQSLSALEVLPVHLTLSVRPFLVPMSLALFFFGTAIVFSLLTFRRTAREGLSE